MKTLTRYQKQQNKLRKTALKQEKETNKKRALKGLKPVFIYDKQRRYKRAAIKSFKLKIAVRKSRLHHLKNLNLVSFFKKNTYIHDVRIITLPDEARFYNAEVEIYFYNNYQVTGISFKKKGKKFFRWTGEALPLKKTYFKKLHRFFKKRNRIRILQRIHGTI